MLKVIVGSLIIGASIVGASAIQAYFSPYQTCVRAFVAENGATDPKFKGGAAQQVIDDLLRSEAQLKCSRH